MQTTAVVVIGAGAFGASTAYHLARRGASVTLVDQHALGSQTSPRAAGLTSKAASSLPVMARLRHEACDALERFEQDMGRSRHCRSPVEAISWVDGRRSRSGSAGELAREPEVRQIFLGG